MYYVYILKNPDKKLYVGCTNNPVRRLEYHKAGHASRFTKQHKNFHIVYTEEFPTLILARRRERQIKGWRHEKKEKLVLGML